MIYFICLILGFISSATEVFILKRYIVKNQEYAPVRTMDMLGIFLYNTATYLCSIGILERAYSENMRGIPVCLLIMTLTIHLTIVSFMDERASHFEFSELFFSLIIEAVEIIIVIYIKGFDLIKALSIPLMVMMVTIIILSLFAYTVGDGILLIQIFILQIVLLNKAALGLMIITLFASFGMSVLKGIPKTIKAKRLNIKTPFTACIAVGYSISLLIISLLL